MSIKRDLAVNSQKKSTITAKIKQARWASFAYLDRESKNNNNLIFIHLMIRNIAISDPCEGWCEMMSSILADNSLKYYCVMSFNFNN